MSSTVMLGLDLTFVSFEDWAAAVKKAGGVVTRMPEGEHKGQLCARLPVPGTSGWRYELAPLGIRLRDTVDDLRNTYDRAMGANADAATAVLSPAAAVGNAVLDPVGTVARELGIPRPVVLALAGVVLYAALVNAGIAPPLSRLFK